MSEPGFGAPPEPIVLEAPDPVEPPLERITLYLHPTVPEASLCVLRPWIPLNPPPNRA